MANMHRLVNGELIALTSEESASIVEERIENIASASAFAYVEQDKMHITMYLGQQQMN